MGRNYKLYWMMIQIFGSLVISISLGSTNKSFYDPSKHLVYSFTDTHYLVQVNGLVYQIKNLNLPNEDNEKLKKIVIQSHIDMASNNLKSDNRKSNNNDSLNLTPQRIVHRIPTRAVASITPLEVNDGVRLNQNELIITGTLLFYDETSPFITIKSNNYIYQIKRNPTELLNSDLNSDLSSDTDLQNTKLSLTFPIKDIEYIWTLNPIKIVKLED